MNRSSTVRALRGFALPLCLLLCGGGALALPAGAGAAESIYWSSGNSGAVAVETGSVTTTGAAPEAIFKDQSAVGDIALDPAAGDIFWTQGETIASGSLKGGTVATPFENKADLEGLTIEAGKLYWGAKVGEIFEGATAGGTATPVAVTGAGVVTSVVADGATLYLSNEAGEILSAPITGGPAEELFNGQGKPADIAIDAAAATIYWTDESSGEILDGPLAGKVTATVLDKGQTGVEGIALEPGTSPSTGKIYWAKPGEILVGSLAAEGGTEVFPTTGTSAGLALLETPVSAATPAISGTPAIGDTLTCNATWDADLPESQLYRAPTSGLTTYKWFHDGTEIKEATSSTLKLKEGGEITCQAIAANAAGPTTSAKSAVAAVPIPAPAVSISTPASGETYLQHESVPTKFTCTEGAGGPGFASCADSNGINGTVSGTKASGAGDLNTATPGSYTYTVSVASKDGQKASAAISYKVVAYDSVASLPEVTISSLAKNAKAGKVAVKLACEPGLACTGKLTLTAKVKVKVSTKARKGKKTKTKTETLTLASGSYSIAAGRSKTVELALSSKALKALAQAKTTKPTVNLTATVKGGLSASASGKLALAATKAKQAKSGKKAKTGKKTSKG